MSTQVEARLAEKFQALCPHLDERQRRLAIGAEARSPGAWRDQTCRPPGRGAGGALCCAGRLNWTPVRRRWDGLAGRAVDLGSGLRPALPALVEPDMRVDLCRRCAGRRSRPATWPTSGPDRATASRRRPWLTCSARKASACRATPGRSRAASSRTGTGSSAISTSRQRTTRPPGTRWSAWTPKEGTGRQLQERRPRVAPRGRTGPGADPRLPGPGAGQGRPVRDLRSGREHRMGQRGYRPRHRGVRGGVGPALMERRWRWPPWTWTWTWT